MVYKELQDLTHLKWARIRHSSGTAGSFLKSYEMKGGKKIYYKLSNYNSIEGIVGHECVNEVIADRLLTLLDIPHLAYDLIYGEVSVDGKKYRTWLCASEDFKKPDESKIPFELFYELERRAEESPLEFCKRMGWEKYVNQMLLVDFLILNRDRHGANVEILRDRTKRTVRPAPLFDHGLSLLFSCHSDEELLRFRPEEDKPVQCFLGSHSSGKNLSLISKRGRVQLPDFDVSVRRYLFQDLEDAVSSVWKDCVWNMICKRAKEYESTMYH